MRQENEWQVYGIPGAGKTTYLTQKIITASKQAGGENLLVSSFTRAAAEELIGRDLPIPQQNVGTLHSLCYRALGTPPIAETKIKDFNEDNPTLALSSSKNVDLDESEADQSFETEADELFQAYQLARSKLVPREKWQPRTKHFADRWERWKEANGLIDFTDMIETALNDLVYPPNNPTIGIFDEAQDFTPLQLKLIRHWAKSLNYIMIAGDDDQCQPGSTIIKTITGDVKMEDLNPRTDRLIAYSREDAAAYGMGNGGYSFEKERRYYAGQMYTVAVDDTQTKCTDNHIWLAKWTQEAKKSKDCCVYLMQRGDRFRVGWCQLFRADGCFHLNVRANHEKAEKVWILDIFQDRYDAAAHESLVATKYGLPVLMFEPAETITKQYIEYVFSNLDPGEQIVRAINCLNDHGRDIRYPAIDRNQNICKFGSRIFKCRACNLMSGRMEVPRHYSGKRNEWQVATVSSEAFEGYVYSLNVYKYHTYIADGIVTHNCLYNFTGADPHALLTDTVPSDKKVILDRSYRVPRVIQEHAKRWIERIGDRQPKDQKPKLDPGTGEVVEGRLLRTNASLNNPQSMVRLIEDKLAELEEGEDLMVLATCSYMLNKTIAELRRRGIPFANKYKKKKGQWNPLNRSKGVSTTQRVLSYLKPTGPEFARHRLWTSEQLALWIELCQSKKLLQHGAKKKIKEAATGDLSTQGLMDLIAESFIPEKLNEAIKLDLDWLRNHVTSTKANALEFPVAVLKRFGEEGLSREPNLQIGTIHSVKGGQASHVILAPDISMQAWQAGTAQPGKEALIRQFYVGLTRAKEELVVTSPATNLYVSI